VTKVLLQILAKRSNTLWKPKTIYDHDKCMLMSFDTAKMKNGRSIICLIATVNSGFTSYFSKTKEFQNLDEKYQPMFELYLLAIEYYFARNKFYPK
jgi:uncharacterized protein YfbU (UPF0304 family)